MAKLDTQDWRDRYDQMGARWEKLYQQRAPVLKNYEKTVQTSLDALIGETIPAMQSMYRQAAGMGEFTEKEFMPAATKYMRDAAGYDTPERRAAASGRAMSDVGTAGEQSRQNAIQQLESFGIDPSMTRGAALDQNVRLQTALEQVRAGREAAEGVENRGQAYLRDALGLGAGIQEAGSRTAATAATLGTGASNMATNAASTFANIYGTPVQNLEARRGMIDASLGAKTTEANFKAGQSGSSTLGAIGGTIGMAAGMAGGYAMGNPQGGAQAGAAQGSMWGNIFAGEKPGMGPSNPSASRAAAGY